MRASEKYGNFEIKKVGEVLAPKKRVLCSDTTYFSGPLGGDIQATNIWGTSLIFLWGSA